MKAAFSLSDDGKSTLEERGGGIEQQRRGGGCVFRQERGGGLVLCIPPPRGVFLFGSTWVGGCWGGNRKRELLCPGSLVVGARPGRETQSCTQHESCWWEVEKGFIFHIVRISTTYTCIICIKIFNTGLASSICKCLCRLPSLLAGAFRQAKGGLEWRGGAEREKREGALPASVEEGASVGLSVGGGGTDGRSAAWAL